MSTPIAASNTASSLPHLSLCGATNNLDLSRSPSLPPKYQSVPKRPATPSSRLQPQQEDQGSLLHPSSTLSIALCPQVDRSSPSSTHESFSRGAEDFLHHSPALLVLIWKTELLRPRSTNNRKPGWWAHRPEGGWGHPLNQVPLWKAFLPCISEWLPLRTNKQLKSPGCPVPDSPGVFPKGNGKLRGTPNPRQWNTSREVG